MLKKLNSLHVGDAFKYNDIIYIAIALTPDPFDVYCLNTFTHKLEEIEEEERVELLNDWYVMEFHNEPPMTKGKKLDVLY